MSRYDKGRAGKLLGYQYISQMVTKENVEDIKELMGERYIELIKDPLMTCVDCFMLGFIYGKRAERQRKKVK